MPKHITVSSPEWTAISGSSGTLTVAAATASTDAVNLSTLTRAGFTDRSASLMSFNTGTRLFTISATGPTFDVFANNVRYTMTGTALALAPLTGAEQYVYFNSAGALTAALTPWNLSDPSVAPVSLVYWGMTGISGTFADERHNAYRDRFLHRYLHNTRGTAYDNGLIGTFFAGNSGSFSFSSGRVWDEDINWDISGPSTTARFWFRSGSAMRFYDNATSSFSGATNAPVYDLNGVPTPVTNTDFFNAWFYATTEYTHSISIVMGQGQYGSLGAAAAEGEPSIPGRSTREWKLLYQTIYRLNAGTTTFQSATDYRGAATLPGQGQSNTLPASQVSYIPSAPLSATNAQAALDQVVTQFGPAYGGLAFDAALASAGPANDHSGSLASGTWGIISGSWLSGTDRYNVSASNADGRLYAQTNAIYLVIGNMSCEAVGNPVTWNGHLGVFITGTEAPRWTVAMDMDKDITMILAVNALVSLASGTYVDLRVRPSADIANFTVHHMQFLMHRVG